LQAQVPWEEDIRMVTIREVAQLAGVSPTTVSHVINQTRFVSSDVTRRVEQAMRQLDYRPNALARSLRRGETRTIGMILPDSSNPFFAELGHAIECELFRRQYSLILCNSEGDLQKEQFYTRVLTEKQVDGIMFISSGNEESSVRVLQDCSTPLVVVDRPCGELEIDVVLGDNYQGGYEAGRYLAGLGHQQVAMIGGPGRVTPGADREAGFRNALQDHGLILDDSKVAAGAFSMETGYHAAQQLLQGPRKPTAVFACNDLMAMGCMRAASESGMSVPGELSVIGFDDIELSSYLVPALTTIAQPKDQIAGSAVELLMNRIADPQLDARRVVLRNTLIQRGSCAAR